MAKRHLNPEKEMEENDKENNPDKEEYENMKHGFKFLNQDDLRNRPILKAKRRLDNKENIGIAPFAAFREYNWSINNENFIFLKNHANSITKRDILKAKDEKKENINITMDEEKKDYSFLNLQRFNQSSSSRNSFNFIKADIRENNSSAAIISNMEDEKESDNDRMDEEETNNNELKITDIRDDNCNRQLQNLNKNDMKLVEFHVYRNSYGDFIPIFNHYEKNLGTFNCTYPVKTSSVSHRQNSFLSGSIFKTEEFLPNDANNAYHDLNSGKISEKENENMMREFKRLNEEELENRLILEDSTNELKITDVDNDRQLQNECNIRGIDFHGSKISHSDLNASSNDYEKRSETYNLIQHAKTNDTPHEQNNFLSSSIFKMDDLLTDDDNDVHRDFNFSNALENENERNCGINFESNFSDTFPPSFGAIHETITSPPTSPEFTTSLTDESTSEKEPIQFSESNFTSASPFSFGVVNKTNVRTSTLSEFATNLADESTSEKEQIQFSESNFTDTYPFSLGVINAATATTSTLSEFATNLTGESTSVKELVQFSSESNFKKESSLKKESFQLSFGHNIQQEISKHNLTSLKLFPHTISFLPFPLRAYLFHLFN